MEAEAERIRRENILHGNPLLAAKSGDFTVKRRYVSRPSPLFCNYLAYDISDILICRIKLIQILAGMMMSSLRTVPAKRNPRCILKSMNVRTSTDPCLQDQGFVNDALRSEFHKKFMSKYIK